MRVSFRDSLAAPVNDVYAPPVVTQVDEIDPTGLSLSSLNYAGVNKNNFGFINRETFTETGWINLNNRFYMPELMRFGQTDPIIAGQEHLSLYQYGWNNPVRFSDPEGKCPNCFTALGGAFLKAGIELGGQLLSGKSIEQVDWSDVGVEFVKGGLMGSGFGVLGVGAIEAGGVIVKSNFDYSTSEGLKTTIDGTKTKTEAFVDATLDVAGGKVAGKIGGKISGTLKETSTKLIAEATATKTAANIAESYAMETGKTGAKTYAVQMSRDATATSIKQKFVSGIAKTAVSPIGEVAKNTYQNKFSDALKKLIINPNEKK